MNQSGRHPARGRVLVLHVGHHAKWLSRLHGRGMFGWPLHIYRVLFSALCLCVIPLRASRAFAESRQSRPAQVPQAHVNPRAIRLPVIDGNDIRFRRLSGSAGLSQTRVQSIVQDNLGFMWFGTQYGLNRYDGYGSKVFKHETGRSDSLSCVYIRSLFVGHSGTLWVGCDRFLDKFEPTTETFAHYRIDTQVPSHLPAPIERINEDDAGILWLATFRGLYKFDPATGKTTRYTHDPSDPTSIGGNLVSFAGEDRTGRFWVADGGGLDEFDRKTGKVIRHVALRSGAGEFHEDKFGVLWMLTSDDSSCTLATLNPKTNLATCYSIDHKTRGVKTPVHVYAMLESREGTMWVGSRVGLLKLDQEHKRLINYHNHPSDNESPESDNVINIYQDKEENIWTCFQETEPNFFSERPPAFENFTYQRGSLVNPLVTSIYEDRNGILWIGSMGGLNRIDRRRGKNTVPAGTGVRNELLSILEDRSGVLFAGTYHKGLQRLDPETGEVSPYVRSRGPSNLDKRPIARLTFDHEGTLWAATYGAVGRLDRATGNFITYTPEKQNTIEYQEIKEDRNGMLWLGAQSGLHRFDPHTGQFTIYAHDLDDPRSLSDNRVNSVHFDRSGTMWIGTQNGLDKFDLRTGTFKSYYERDGLAGNVVSCVLEDERGHLWMGTNNGLSSFDPQAERFQSFSAADGLPGPDLTGWSACYQSPSGEMFFGGFSGATAFHPSRIVGNSFVPRTVLTDFRLSGNAVPIGSGSPLKKSITYTDAITLPHGQNIFSIEFSALSYFNAPTNRYRHKLEGLDNRWHEVGSDQRTASYTTLPARTYIFDVQGATSRGQWSEPGARLRIEILPAWYQTWWFRLVSAAFILVSLWLLYKLRIRNIEERERQFRKLAENAPDIVMRFDPGMRYSYVNPIIEEYTGLAPRALLGRTNREVGMSAENVQSWEAALREVFTTGRATTKEFTFDTPRGERYFESRLVPEVGAVGVTKSVLAITRDITDRKRAEEERERLRQAQEDLARVSRVTTMGELTASLAHEVNQPIAAAITNSKTCLRWLTRDPPDVEEAREAVSRIVKDATRAADIVKRIRSMFKKGTAQREPVDVNEVIRDVIVLLRSEAYRYSVSIREDLATCFARVMADRVQLQQVLTNLMLNGIEAMKEVDGARELTVKSEQAGNSDLLISVSDTGVGLAPEQAEQIFKAFFSTKADGTGMGLSISRSIIESHGGRLWAAPNSGRGATFQFTLPREVEGPE
jgi:PAS domain S-box-containing protein